MTVLPDDGLSLAAEFPDATRERWQRLVEGVLRKSGASEATGLAAEEALYTTLEDGLSTHPLYTSDDVPAALAAPGATGSPGETGALGDPTALTGLPGFAPYVRGGRPEGRVESGWDVRQQHRDPDPRRANELVLADLEHGVTSLWIVLGEAGLAVEDLPRALEGVYLDLAPIILEPGPDFAAAAEELLSLYERHEVSPSAAAGNLGADPLGLLARTGVDDRTDALLGEASDWVSRIGDTHQNLRVMTVDALPYHDAGGSPAEELGASLATGVAYLRQLTDAGVSVEQACRQLEFRYAASADQFLTIAKLRAARRLWARVAEVCGVREPSAGAQRQHAVTSSVMVTRRDPWVNMLRTTVATLAAGVGGADSVSVLPFDHAAGLPDGFARRIARNTSVILVEESHIARVIDPAGGSWYVETLTDELAHAGWAFFQEIERAGGQRAALRDGFVAERLEATWQRRLKALARRKEPVTGVSEFPNLPEELVQREAAPAPLSGGLPRVRRDESYEALRARSDEALARDGVRPRILLAALGSPAAYTARSTFAANLFQAGGVEPLTQEIAAQTDAAAATALLAESGASVVCLCSSDKVYAEEAASVAAAFKAAGARRVLLAGRPGESRETLEGAGVDEFVFAGGDAVALLTSLQDELLGTDGAPRGAEAGAV